MVVMLVVLVALGTIAGLTVISVQGGATQASAQRFSAMALYAAESGAAAAMSWLRSQYHVGNKFSHLVDRDNNPGRSPPEIPGNGVQPGEAGNLLSADQQGWYEVKLLNNPGDPGFSRPSGFDTDGIITIQVTGHGPNGAMKVLEWEVYRPEAPDEPPNQPRPLVLVGWRDLF
jgi:hypothetical protein